MPIADRLVQTAGGNVCISSIVYLSYILCYKKPSDPLNYFFNVFHLTTIRICFDFNSRLKQRCALTFPRKTPCH